MSEPSVLVVDNAPAVGGVQRTLRAVLPGLAVRGVRLTFAVSRDSPCIEWYRAAGLEVQPIDLPPARSLPAIARGALAVAGAARRARCDVVHVHSTRAGIAATVARPLLLGRSLVWSIHEGQVPRTTRLLAPFASTVVLRSEAQRSGNRWLRGGHARVIYPGLAPPDPAAAARRTALRAELGAEGETLLLGSVGTLTAWKGVEVFLRALPVIFAAEPRARAVIVGGESPLEPGYRASLERLAAMLGIADRVRFTGYREDGPEVAGALDLLVHAPTLVESFGIAPTDGMMRGVPVLVSALGSMMEIVTDGLEGRVFTPGDAGALARTALDMLRDPEARARTGAAGRAKAARYTLDAEVDAYLDVYRRLTGERAAR